MKKALFSVVLFLFSIFSLYAVEVTFSDDVDEEMRGAIERSIVASLDRDDISFSVSDYAVNEELFSPSSLISFKLSSSFGDDYAVMALVEKKGKAIDAVSQAVRRALFYNPEADDTRLFIYDGNVSYKTDELYKRGTTLNALDYKGLVRGSFSVSGREDGFVTLDTIYSKDLIPSLELRKGTSLSYDISFGVGLDQLLNTSAIISSYRPPLYFSASLSYGALLYPFALRVGGAVIVDGNSISYGPLAGLSTYVELNKVFGSNLAIIRNGRIGGAFDLIPLLSASSFKADGAISIFYELSVNAHFAVKVGYLNLIGIAQGVTLGVGGHY